MISEYNTSAVHEMVFAILRTLSDRFVPQRPAYHPVSFSIMKDIQWLEWQYAVTENWRVWSYKSNRFLSPWISNKRYLSVDIGGKSQTIHRLVAQAYIPNSEAKPYINHIDGNGFNNNVSNLEWCTQSENIKHAFRVLGRTISQKNRYRLSGMMKERFSKKVYCVKNGEKLFFDSMMDAYRKTWIRQESISLCVRWKQNTAWWLEWFLS